jgi:hypothetical protein
MADMRIAFPPDVRRVGLDHAERAINELTGIIGELRGRDNRVAADLQPLARETVETAVAGGAFLLAMVMPSGVDPALLTGVALEIPDGWNVDSAEALRDSMEDVGGPDVRETLAISTPVGPAVLVQRVPGVEQARTRQPLTLQLQGFIAEPGINRMLLLTLASPSQRGWDVHQRLFTELVASASPSHCDGEAVIDEDQPFDLRACP